MTSSGELPGEFNAGDIIGGTYEILDYIGRGSMGYLYHVRHTMLNTEYALKVLTSDKVTELDWKRFQIEAQATSIMTHPNVVTIYNLGLHDRILPFYVMDLLHGVDLGQKIRVDGPLEIREAVAVFIEVCAGIGYAHKKGIIHRDIKPGNIFLLDKADPTGATVKVVDFGIAKLTVAKNQETQSLTSVGDVVGTPYYMSPEQCMGLRVDARSDIYSLGCTLFEALTGTLPFRARNPTETMLLHQSEPPPSLNKASGGKDFPSTLEYLIATALAKQLSERYQTMDQLSLDLSAVLEGNNPVRVVSGGATIEKVPALQPLLDSGTENVPERRFDRLMSSVVASVVAGLVALGGWAYWQYIYKPQVAHTTQVAKMAQPLSLPDPLQKLSMANPSGKTTDDPSAVKVDFERQTAAFEKAKLTSVLEVNKPFSISRKINGKKMRCFDFPVQPVIGMIKEDEEWSKFVKAAGQVKFPEKSLLVFRPGEVVEQDPDCLKRFREHEIYGLEFAHPDDSLPVLIATINIPGVQKLDFTKSRRLADPPPNTLRQFHNLEKYISSMSQTDGASLAEAGCWGHMKELFLPTARNVLPLLKELKTSKGLEKLGLGPSQLSAQDYEAIASLSHLNYLDLNGNRVTSTDLKVLGGLHSLVDLNLIHTDVDASALDTIRHFEKLKHLYISSRQLSPSDFQKIKGALPKVDVKDTMK